jgi:DNA-binding transcriptional regulator YdaS (Cro superfamily)
MKAEQLIEYFGGQAKAAAYLGIPRQTVFHWVSRGIPLKEQFRIERVTAGKLQAERPIERA